MEGGGKGASPMAHSSGLGPGGQMAHLMPLSFYPDPCPRGFSQELPPTGDAARKLGSVGGGEQVGRLGQEEGPWAWSLGREHSGKSVFPNTPGWKKGHPIGSPKQKELRKRTFSLGE